MVLEDGSVRALSGLSVRVTEYSVGERGPNAMPAQLPASSGYTYAVEFAADEAVAAAATEVRFEPPIVAYVEKILGLPGWNGRAGGLLRPHSGVVDGLD